ncbi:hypothetical protein [Halalkalibacter akibai]|uniref:Uncharacterized protein n=1 Tax=Halalkalibacter akibai (strain ATCC 43226 / DSM 21942 / CIP 109018 / JCM 9157 / 1139) TaxID=1236973 RepID=W4QUY6_HALA3|nr:hypothetical protein [Halalkalibacter akibai]GAE35149.1 hypothetical protein JCM9157_2244 [Halalkalibacter akibai JCM 9157]
MEWVSRIILHIENYFLLSIYSKLIIQFLMTALILYAVARFFSSKVREERVIFYIGFAIRIILLIGLSIEMHHQVKLTELTSIYYEKDQSIRQFLYFLTYGYVLIVGFYYILTINQKATKGLFYTFDIAVLSLPVLQLLTSFAIYLMIGNQFELGSFIFLIIIISFISALLILFFKNYWTFNLNKLILFYILVIMPILPIFIQGNGIRMHNLMELTNFALFLALLMTYHLLESTSKPAFHKGQSYLQVAIVALFFLFMNPLYNLGDVALATTDAEVKLRFFEEVDLLTFNEARNLAMKLTGDEEFYFYQRPNEDFHNVYKFSNENFSIDIDGVSGMVLNFHKHHSVKGSSLTNEDYISLSRKTLESLGRNLLPEDRLSFTVSDSENRVSVDIAPTYSDGSVIEETYPGTTLIWENETLMEMHEWADVYQIDSLRNTRVTNSGIKEKLTNWFELLDLEVPPYAIRRVQYGYSNRRIELMLETKERHNITIDGISGEIISFNGDFPENQNFSEWENRLLAEKGISKSKWIRHRESNWWVWTMEKPSDRFLMYEHRFGYQHNDTFFSYDKAIDYFSIPKSKTKNAGSKEAIEIVLDHIGQFPYATRTRFTHVINQHDEIKPAWLVVVQPYGSSERKLYLVNIETKEVEPLYE